jgi:hypothetical protein
LLTAILALTTESSFSNGFLRLQEKFVPSQRWAELSCRVARFYMAQHTKTGHIYQNYHKMNYKWPLNIRNGINIRPHGHKIYPHLSLQDTPNLTQIGIFVLKMYHLATLLSWRLALLKKLKSGGLRRTRTEKCWRLLVWEFFSLLWGSRNFHLNTIWVFWSKRRTRQTFWPRSAKRGTNDLSKCSHAKSKFW